MTTSPMRQRRQTTRSKAFYLATLFLVVWFCFVVFLMMMTPLPDHHQLVTPDHFRIKHHHHRVGRQGTRKKTGATPARNLIEPVATSPATTTAINLIEPSVAAATLPTTTIGAEGTAGDTASACLLVCDDNHFLIEWIAYHYHVINLRHLIIHADPFCLTNPSKIVHRWRSKMTIELWNDTDFNFVQNADDDEPAHRPRQRQFNKHCLRTLKDQSNGWVYMADTDEFVTISPDLIKSDNVKYNNLPNIREPGSILAFVKNLPYPSLKFAYKTPCLPIHRFQFSAVDSPITSIQQGIPSSFHDRATNFLTLRWRKYESEDGIFQTALGRNCETYRTAGPGKTFIDLERVTQEDLRHPSTHGNPHQPIEKLCRNLFAENTALVIFHYLGSWEQYNYRSTDSRGLAYRHSRYDDMNISNVRYESDQVKPWLEGFVQSVGEMEALRLLEGVGELEPLPNNNNDEPINNNNNETVITTTGNNNTTDEKQFKVGDILHVWWQDEWNWGQVWAVAGSLYHIIYFYDCDKGYYFPLHKLRAPTNDTKALLTVNGEDVYVGLDKIMELVAKKQSKKKQK